MSSTSTSTVLEQSVEGTGTPFFFYPTSSISGTVYSINNSLRNLQIQRTNHGQPLKKHLRPDELENYVTTVVTREMLDEWRNSSPSMPIHSHPYRDSEADSSAVSKDDEKNENDENSESVEDPNKRVVPEVDPRNITNDNGDSDADIDTEEDTEEDADADAHKGIDLFKSATRVFNSTFSHVKSGLLNINGNEDVVIEIDSEDDDCLICFEKIEVGDKVRQLPCSHRFHKECLDNWLTTRSYTCPNCRIDLRTHPDVDDSSLGDVTSSRHRRIHHHRRHVHGRYRNLGNDGSTQTSTRGTSINQRDSQVDTGDGSRDSFRGSGDNPRSNLGNASNNSRNNQEKVRIDMRVTTNNDDLPENSDGPGRNSNDSLPENVDNTGRNNNDNLSENVDNTGRNNNDNLSENVDNPGRNNNDNLDQNNTGLIILLLFVDGKAAGTDIDEEQEAAHDRECLEKVVFYKVAMGAVGVERPPVVDDEVEDGEDGDEHHGRVLGLEADSDHEAAETADDDEGDAEQRVVGRIKQHAKKEEHEEDAATEQDVGSAVGLAHGGDTSKGLLFVHQERFCQQDKEPAANGYVAHKEAKVKNQAVCYALTNNDGEETSNGVQSVPPRYGKSRTC
ncbi:putative E3 ubiquitin-protein ligase RHA2B [Smittium mucronatum]|uniref:Putative E3 ubiquitin-protein ligase RHA2B n=1 Tax=Smittium mucronatum TaxID=133383 RepID=A0A1R0H718_9FUNG|nr:putative E3 ubiquitin-protein ligase RHA2B [Smittium mucronatum]